MKKTAFSDGGETDRKNEDDDEKSRTAGSGRQL